MLLDKDLLPYLLQPAWRLMSYEKAIAGVFPLVLVVTTN